MFTIQQIDDAHAKVKTGADFPKYIQEIKELGVTAFDFLVSNGVEVYYGEEPFKAHSSAKYDPLNINENLNAQQFAKELKEHQEGKTDFPYFVKMCAVNGIASWKVDLEEYTCTYFDLEGEEVLQEEIPGNGGRI
ncbi:MAG: DUF1398 domain-containing protein [Sphingobacterium hotanense]